MNYIYNCPFCNPPSDREFFSNDLVVGLWDGFPVSPGHALLVTKRHVTTWFDATSAEQRALLEAVEAARQEVEKDNRPDGYNIGVNIGAAGGQTIFHLHMHVIPRYEGDVHDPRGGIRHVIPGKANYLTSSISEGIAQYAVGTPNLIISGGVDPLWPHLAAQLNRAKSVDVVVAFVKKSGTQLLWPRLAEVIDRGGSVRLLTGDYLGISDPDAMVELLNLSERKGGNVKLRVFNTGKLTGIANFPQAFHPKAYIFKSIDGAGSAFVGSSNLSASALNDGIEWNYQVISSRDGQGFVAIEAAFENIFAHPATCELNIDWIDTYRTRRHTLSVPLYGEDVADHEHESTPEMPSPHAIQAQALEALSDARQRGMKGGLVVLATGLGKTWLSAFDSIRFARVLFVAHREEILNQAFETFRKIRPGEYLGLYNGNERHQKANVLFASIQTLSRKEHLESFDTSHFDYIVIDEFHHAEAKTYRRVLQHFEPKFLLGLTATPERSDGADLLDLCGGNLLFRCDLAEGIRNGLLCPFHYFGVPDEVDYTNIPWRSARFDEEKLTNAVATRSRAQNALEQLERRGGKRVIAFCVSQRHARFMAEFLKQKGKRVVAVHSGSDSAPRTESLERLQRGELDIICAVDMFNEGVDLPELDTVMMLRPTESRILWLQQFGRGLRKSDAEKRLKVIDYIGNHRSFLLKPRTLFDLPSGDSSIQNLLQQVAARTLDLPPGCEVTYDLETINILRGLLRVAPNASEAIRAYIEDFIELHGVRPTALETYRDGYNPRAVRHAFGSWLGFIERVGALDVDDVSALKSSREFLEALEVTQMSKSYKMVVLLAMLDSSRLPGKVSIERLIAEVRRLVERHPKLVDDFSSSLESENDLKLLLEQNPIAAWSGGAGTGGRRYFDYDGKEFSSNLAVAEDQCSSFQSLVREIAEWRLAEYMDRRVAQTGYELKVNHSNGQPILMLPSRSNNPELPEGWTHVSINGGDYSANFVKVAVNVVRAEGSEENQLPALMRAWFGPSAGAPGTRHHVRLSQLPDGNWTFEPVGAGILTPVLWKSYSREQIPPLFSLEFNKATWQQGFVRKGNLSFLLVTLDKSTAIESQKYKDHFLSPDSFQWQSQNQTKRDSNSGRSICNHQELNIGIQLFVRPRSKLVNGKACPFTYCGKVDFVSWEHDNPITVVWKLQQPVPDRLRAELKVPSH